MNSKYFTVLSKHMLIRKKNYDVSNLSQSYRTDPLCIMKNLQIQLKPPGNLGFCTNKT